MDQHKNRVVAEKFINDNGIKRSKVFLQGENELNPMNASSTSFLYRKRTIQMNVIEAVKQNLKD